MDQQAYSDRVVVPSVVLVVEPTVGPALEYAVERFAEFCRTSPRIGVLRRPALPEGLDGALVVLAGRAAAERHAPDACRGIDWAALGDEGFVLRSTRRGEAPVVVAAGATEAGTRHAVYALLCQLDVSVLPPTLPRSLDRAERPSFPLRGMYAHQHWAYRHPYALRTWSIDEWRRYVDVLALLRVNLFQIWSMAGILPVPLSPDDETFLRRYPPVIEHAKTRHGMEVWIGECANNMCDRRDVRPVAEREYFDVEVLKDPADPKQMEQLRAARKVYYEICNNADGYWVIDSDPGGYTGSPASQFVDILMMNRRLIDEHTRAGRRAKLVYWMWMSWGTGDRAVNIRDAVRDLAARNPEPWRLTACWKEHWAAVDEFGLADRTIYYPYGAVEPEPSLPFTTVAPPNLLDHLKVSDRVGKLAGIMANAQTPICQLPNIYYFQRAAWNMSQHAADRETAMAELARLIYPEHAGMVTRCWMSLGSAEAPNAAALADELDALARDGRLGRPGPIGWLLFPDAAQVARDLAEQLRIHGVAMSFCRMADDPKVDDAALIERLTAYCLLSLAWRRRTGFNRFGTNGYNFFPLHAAAHKRWWRDERLDPRVYAALESAMQAEYDPWEAKLILDPLNH